MIFRAGLLCALLLAVTACTTDTTPDGDETNLSIALSSALPYDSSDLDSVRAQAIALATTVIGRLDG